MMLNGTYIEVAMFYRAKTSLVGLWLCCTKEFELLTSRLAVGAPESKGGYLRANDVPVPGFEHP